MLKTKIIKILPWWGISLGLVSLFLLAGSLIDNSKAVSITTAQAAPQVLGASIDLRGQTPTPPTAPVLGSGFDDSQVSSKSYLVADADTDSLYGSIIVQKNSGQKEYVASLTKLLTGLVSYQNVNLNTMATITPNDVFSVSPVLGLHNGDTVSLMDLFNAMLVGSENDAALALSNHVQTLTSQNFVEAMNIEAASLGMADSHFSNPLGFDSPGNYSTAQDILKLVLATQRLSVFTSLGEKISYSFISGLGFAYRAKATDTLIGKHPEIQAIKTGFTQGAGQAMATKVTQNGHAIYIIVLDSQDREADTLELERQIFDNIQW